jgi:hypothetical protein
MKHILAAAAALAVLFALGGCQSSPTSPAVITHRPPVIKTFILEPATVAAGDRYLLSFNVSFENREAATIRLTASGAGWENFYVTETSVGWYIEGGFDVASYNMNPYGSNSATFTLFAQDPYGSVSATKTLTVTP